MSWEKDTPWNKKLQQVLDRIDELAADNIPVAVIGTSAGATAAISAYAQRRKQVVGCVVIAGKVNHPETIGAEYRRHNPALFAASTQCAHDLATLSLNDRKNILSLYATVDTVVEKNDSIIRSAVNKRLFSFGHIATIALQLVFGWPRYITFLKQRAAEQTLKG